MKKLLLTFLVLTLTMTMYSQTSSIESGPFTRSMPDLPIGKQFIVMPLNGDVTFTGIIDSTTINYMPINTPFILKVEGRKSEKFNIYDKKTLN